MKQIPHIVEIADKNRIVQTKLFSLHGECFCRRLVT